MSAAFAIVVRPVSKVNSPEPKAVGELENSFIKRRSNSSVSAGLADALIEYIHQSMFVYCHSQRIRRLLS